MKSDKAFGGNRALFVRLAGAATLLVVAVVSYWPAITGSFIWDDDMLLTRNELVKASDGLYRIWFTTQAVDYWPVTNSSFWIEWRLWGTNPMGYHLTNVLLHAISAFLLWEILKRVTKSGAFLGAMVFLVHPVNVESVAWIAERKNTASMCLFLLSIFLYLKDEVAGRWYWASLIAFVAAMLAKGSVAVMPAVLLLIAWWLHDRITMRDLAKIAPFFLIATALTIVNLWFQTHGDFAPVRQLTVLQRVLGAGAVIWLYLYKAVLPLNLSFVYPQWTADAANIEWWIPLFMVLAVTVVLILQRRKPWVRATLFAWAYFCIGLIPVMGFTDVYFMRYAPIADHYQYISIIAVAALMSAAIDRGLST